MKKKRDDVTKKAKMMVAIIVGTVMVVLVFCCIYARFYRINTENLHWTFLSRAESSPDNQYNISVRILRENENSDTSYIQGIIGERETDSHSYTRDPRVVFWQKVDSRSIGGKKMDQGILENWIEVQWIDSDNICINGIEFNIKRGYDYRRD